MVHYISTVITIHSQETGAGSLPILSAEKHQLASTQRGTLENYNVIHLLTFVLHCN
ncbi:MAG: hypothetical protein ACI9JM_002505 [Halioglobus sp.]|jgi:hypothetical protein